MLQRVTEPAPSGFTSTLFVTEIPEPSDKPSVVAYREKLKAAFYPDGFPPGRPSEYDTAAYTAAKITEAALDKVGRNLTREAFVDALESMKNFDIGMTFPVSFSKDNHEGTTL